MPGRVDAPSVVVVVTAPSALPSWSALSGPGVPSSGRTGPSHAPAASRVKLASRIFGTSSLDIFGLLLPAQRRLRANVAAESTRSSVEPAGAHDAQDRLAVRPARQRE